MFLTFGGHNNSSSSNDNTFLSRWLVLHAPRQEKGPFQQKRLPLARPPDPARRARAERGSVEAVVRRKRAGGSPGPVFRGEIGCGPVGGSFLPTAPRQVIHMKGKRKPNDDGYVSVLLIWSRVDANSNPDAVIGALSTIVDVETALSSSVQHLQPITGNQISAVNCVVCSYNSRLPAVWASEHLGYLYISAS